MFQCKLRVPWTHDRHKHRCDVAHCLCAGPLRCHIVLASWARNILHCMFVYAVVCRVLQLAVMHCLVCVKSMCLLQSAVTVACSGSMLASSDLHNAPAAVSALLSSLQCAGMSQSHGRLHAGAEESVVCYAEIVHRAMYIDCRRTCESHSMGSGQHSQRPHHAGDAPLEPSMHVLSRFVSW